MAYLSDENINELKDKTFKNKYAIIKRNRTTSYYELIEPKSNGQKGLVWLGKDDLGNDVAIKIIPADEYKDRSLIDEMDKAQKLSQKYFSQIFTFGDFSIENANLKNTYSAIVSRWINGKTFTEFIDSDLISVKEFMDVACQLFTALANLYNNKLCHDDLHTGNILIEKRQTELNLEEINHIVIVDTGTIKPIEIRDQLLAKLRSDIEVLKEHRIEEKRLQDKLEFLRWKEPNDHLRIVDALVQAANGLISNYYKLDFSERRFIERLNDFFQALTDPDTERRLQAPQDVINYLNSMLRASEKPDEPYLHNLSTPFDYISSEMIRNDKEFADLFSLECPWLEECKALQPLYIYGPRGCGKSSVLRWLSFKTFASDDLRKDFSKLTEIGIYISCSVELRSRFWLLEEKIINNVQTQTIKYFNLLLLEELFDTLYLMLKIQDNGEYDFDLDNESQRKFTYWFLQRLQIKSYSLRLEGQSYFEFLKSLVRRERWETWGSIQKNEKSVFIPDPSLVSDVVKEISVDFTFFKNKSITFLIDDYSNQRIPKGLQVKLNQTISFAKQASPIFKVSSEYNGIDLDGIQEGREVVEINIGDRYTSINAIQGSKFIENIINKRLQKTKPPYKESIADILGKPSYKNLTDALASDSPLKPFYYHGLETINNLCSGDVSLALDLISRIFKKANITPSNCKLVDAKTQHSVIQEFSADEIKRIKYIVPSGDKMFDVVYNLGLTANAFVRNKVSKRNDPHKKGKPVCKTHIDIKYELISILKIKNGNLYSILYHLMSRAILFSLETSRKRDTFDPTERLQIRRIYLPAFKAPLKRDQPIKIDTIDDLISFLSDPKAFMKRELRKASINENQLEISINSSIVKP